jgi:hypothetical protein
MIVVGGVCDGRWLSTATVIKKKNLSGPTVKLFIIILVGNVCGLWCVSVCDRRRVRYVVLEEQVRPAD